MPNAGPPSTSIRIEGVSGDLLRRLREGSLDVCFRLDRMQVPDCHSRSLWSEQFTIALPETHSLVNAGDVYWRDLVAETFIMRPGGAGPEIFEHIVRRIAEAGRVTATPMAVIQSDKVTLVATSNECWYRELRTPVTKINCKPRKHSPRGEVRSWQAFKSPILHPLSQTKALL